MCVGHRIDYTCADALWHDLGVDLRGWWRLQWPGDSVYKSLGRSPGRASIRKIAESCRYLGCTAEQDGFSVHEKYRTHRKSCVAEDLDQDGEDLDSEGDQSLLRGMEARMYQGFPRDYL